MGMSTCKAGDICNQAWFAGVDWVAIGEMRVQPPFVPEVVSEEHLSEPSKLERPPLTS